MIGSLRTEQQRDRNAFAEGLLGFARGEDSFEAEAAAQNVAEILLIWRKQLTGK